MVINFKISDHGIWLSNMPSIHGSTLETLCASPGVIHIHFIVDLPTYISSAMISGNVKLMSSFPPFKFGREFYFSQKKCNRLATVDYHCVLFVVSSTQNERTKYNEHSCVEIQFGKIPMNDFNYLEMVAQQLTLHSQRKLNSYQKRCSN